MLDLPAALRRLFAAPHSPLDPPADAPAGAPFDAPFDASFDASSHPSFDPARSTLLSPSALASGVLSWIFRPQCAACGDAVASGLPFCAGCAASLEENRVCCPRCAEPIAAARASECRRCRRHPLPLAKIVAPWQYGGALAEAIVRLKFTGHPEVARALAPLIAPVLVATAIDAGAQLIVPIPLHWTRRLRRGFDQSRLLLRHACALNLPPAELLPALRRVRATEYQSRTDDARGRFRNLVGAFQLAPRWRARVAGARVIVFDDVVTTGATMAAAARVLRRAGAEQVIGVALARGGSR